MLADHAQYLGRCDQYAPAGVVGHVKVEQFRHLFGEIIFLRLMPVGRFICPACVPYALKRPTWAVFAKVIGRGRLAAFLDQ
jgi:hypothetical protein